MKIHRLAQFAEGIDVKTDNSNFQSSSSSSILFVIRRFRNEKETEAEICPANESGVITENAPVT